MKAAIATVLCMLIAALTVTTALPYPQPDQSGLQKALIQLLMTQQEDSGDCCAPGRCPSECKNGLCSEACVTQEQSDVSKQEEAIEQMVRDLKSSVTGSDQQQVVIQRLPKEDEDCCAPGRCPSECKNGLCSEACDSQEQFLLKQAGKTQSEIAKAQECNFCSSNSFCCGGCGCRFCRSCCSNQNPPWWDGKR